jgi:hypothetical protein
MDEKHKRAGYCGRHSEAQGNDLGKLNHRYVPFKQGPHAGRPSVKQRGDAKRKSA